MAENTVTISDRAAAKIDEILKDEVPSTMFRVRVEGGGCSGFQYQFELDQDRNDDDLAIEKDGIIVLIDSMSLIYMAGSEIDFVDDLIGASFQINNPNATASCGCGTSFSI